MGIREVIFDLLSSLRDGMHTLSFEERQRVIRLLVERVVVNGDSVTIEHVVPITGRFSGLNINGREWIWREDGL